MGMGVEGGSRRTKGVNKEVQGFSFKGQGVLP